MNVIDLAIADLEKRREAIDLCLESLRAFRKDEPAPPPPTRREAVPKPAKPAKEPKPLVRGGSRERSDLRRDIEQWLDGRDTPFTVEDLPPSLREDRVKASKCLQNLKAKKLLQGVGYAKYCRAGAPAPVTKPSAPAAPFPTFAQAQTAALAPKYNPTPSGAPVLDGKMMRDRAAQAARYIISLHKGKSLGARALIDEARRLFPQLVESENRIQDFRVCLIDAAQAGLLTRIGKGPDAVYCDPVPNS